MRIAILGAGAVGSIVGAHLAAAGHDVVAVARGERLRAVAERGLVIEGIRTVAARVPALEAAEIDACDALIVTTKTRGTEAALASVAHVRTGLVCSLQNGVLKDELLAQAFGADAVVGACTMLAGTLGADGVVDCFLDEDTFVGELDGRRSDRTEQLAAAFCEAGLAADVVADIRAYEWTKQANQASSAAPAALTGLPMYLVWGDRELAKVVVGIVREVVAVARANGVEPTADPRFGFDIRALADGPYEQALERVVARGERLRERGMTNVRPSLATDLAAGRPSELEETIGHVVREGGRLGIAVPLLHLAYAAVRAVEAARIAHAADALPGGGVGLRSPAS